MRIEQLVLHEVACFDHLEIEFPAGKDPTRADVHVLVGDNGTGKSTILRALAQFFTDEDTGLAWRMRGAGARVEMGVPGGIRDITLESTRRRFRGVTSPRSTIVAELLEETSEGMRGFAAFGYSSLRSVEKAQLVAIQEVQGDPLEGALTFVPTSTGTLEQWIANTLAKEAFALQRGDSDRASLHRKTLTRLEAAVGSVTGDAFAFEIVDEPLDVIARFRGAAVHFELLPEGVQSILSWLGDLLMRLERLPWENNLPVLERPFALFLDEIEVHLHPKWQWKVVPMLQSLFPKAQVFLATHSPFVVASAADAWIHRLDLTPTGGVTVRPPLSSRIGQSYETVLDEVLGVHQLFDPDTQKALDDFYVLRDRALQGEDVLGELEARAKALQGRSVEVEAIVGPELRNVRRQVLTK